MENKHLYRHPAKCRILGTILSLALLGITACGPVRRSLANVGGKDAAAATSDTDDPIDDECTLFACEP